MTTQATNNEATVADTAIAHESPAMQNTPPKRVRFAFDEMEGQTRDAIEQNRLAEEARKEVEAARLAAEATHAKCSEAAARIFNNQLETLALGKVALAKIDERYAEMDEYEPGWKMNRDKEKAPEGGSVTIQYKTMEGAYEPTDSKF